MFNNFPVIIHYKKCSVRANIHVYRAKPCVRRSQELLVLKHPACNKSGALVFKPVNMNNITYGFANECQVMIKTIRKCASLVSSDTTSGSNNTYIGQKLVFRIFGDRVHIAGISMIRKRCCCISNNLVRISIKITVGDHFLVNMICVINKEMMAPIIKSLPELSGTRTFFKRMHTRFKSHYTS